MARDMVSITKRSRREKVALHPKAVKYMTRRAYGPGDHGQTNLRSKPSQYAVQLREKQKVKRIYGLLEKQFAKLVAEAGRRSGVAGDNLLSLLEQRLDNTVYRLGFAPSRQGARQLVTHGHLLLNGKRVDIPSIRVSPGDEISIRPKSAPNSYFSGIKEHLSGAGSVSWLSFDGKKMTAKVTSTPTPDDAEQDLNMQLIIEFYSR